MSAEATDIPETATPRAGHEIIASYLKTLPPSPGVYRMIDARGDVIYVGKAKSLKVRVSSYARKTGQSSRIARMIASTASMEFVTVATEAEALLLEANLIKRFKPRYNVTLRDDKSFPYILIARDSEAPQVVKHRGARNRKGDYFGPFASAGAVTRTINMLQRAFLLRSCSQNVYETRRRPCLLYQIKRCSAPCTGEIALDEYAGLVEEAEQFLSGESQNLRLEYQRLMNEAAERLDYELAARYRNRLWALAHVTAGQSINTEGVDEADVFAAHQDGGQTCVQVFFFRTGQNWGNRAYFPKADRTVPVEEVLSSFMAQFYDDKPSPRLILASHDFPDRALLAEALCVKAGRRIDIRVPQRGAKTGLVGHALANAREALGRRLAEGTSQRAMLEGVADRLELPQPPRRVEVFDNSHVSGSNAVGAMIVAGPDGWVKNQYRRFNIKTVDLTPGDDYAMMREVLTRRFKRLVAETAGVLTDDATLDAAVAATMQEAAPLTDIQKAPSPAPLRVAASPQWGEATSQAPTDTPSPRRGEGWGEGADTHIARSDSGELKESAVRETDVAVAPPLTAIEDDAEAAFPARPDLVLIDGGAGQLAVAREVLAELGLHDICVMGVAKGPDRDAGREHFHKPGAAPFMLDLRDPVLYFIQRLRDEAHRFAIGFHRAKRSKAIGVNPLDEIDGVGPTRRRALLQHFGSAKAVSKAGVEDLKAVEGISAEMARRVYDFFHEKAGGPRE